MTIVPRFYPGLRLGIALAAISLLASPRPGRAQVAGETGPWASFVEPGFPFYSSVVDARKSGPLSPANNLTPRGLILNLGHGVQACFDTDLLRVSVVWTGDGVTPVSMAQISYHKWDDKSEVGEETLPQPVGRVWIANGIYPGWQIGAVPVQTDPRTPAPSPEEVGRGALPPALGRFTAVQLTRFGARLEYTVGEAAVRERLSLREEKGRHVLVRWLEVGPSAQPLILVLSRQAPDPAQREHVAASLAGGDGAARLADAGGLLYATLAPHAETVKFAVALASGAAPPEIDDASLPPDVNDPPERLWPQELTTHGVLSSARAPYVLDDIPLPVGNPWHRNFRPADIQFLPDGTAATVTMDGDVWLVHGLGGDLRAVRWKRFASGLHEPLSLAIRGGEIFVFDRNGIWRLRDTMSRGEADRYEMFSNAFAQSADTREYASSIKPAPDGAFVIAKGGLAATYIGKHNGTVIRVSPDGKQIQQLGWGFRGPFIGVNPITGLVTASDQEGRYVPASPIYLVEGNLYHGFLSPFQPHEQYPAPIADPLTWIPHTVCPSALTQVWLSDARMGPLSGSLVLLSYNRPELFRVLINRREAKPQGAVVSLIKGFRFAPLSAGIDPVDGQLYVAGFKSFGTVSERIAGVARLRYTGGPTLLPNEVAPMDRGILLRFDVPLNPAEAANAANYQVERWNYRRRYTYGSLHYRLDGSVGQDRMAVTSAYLSRDGRSVFLGVPDMKTGVMQMHVGWSLSAQDGSPVRDDAYFTPFALSPFRAEAEGFGAIAVDLAPGKALSEETGPVAEGARLYQAFGCMACHSVDGSPRVGPSWKGAFGRSVALRNGATAVVDEAFIRGHLRPHPDRLVLGFEPGMPDYSSLVGEAQAAALVAYIRSLR